MSDDEEQQEGLSVQDIATFLNEELISPLEKDDELSSETANDIRALLSEFRQPEDLRNLGERIQNRGSADEDTEE